MSAPPESDCMYLAVAEVLLLTVQLPHNNNLPAAPELKKRLVSALDTMVGKGRELGIDDDDLTEARYALTAFADEQVFKSQWAGRSEWINEPLQLLLYRERSAGENFFVRLRALLSSGTRSHALQVYYLCLLLGFRGVYGQNGDLQGLASFTEAARQRVSKTLPNPSKLAPNAEPRDRGAAFRTSNAMVFTVVGVCIGLSLLTTFGLRWAAEESLDSAVRVIDVPTLEIH